MSVWLIVIIVIWLFLSGGMLWAYLSEKINKKTSVDMGWKINMLVIVFAPLAIVGVLLIWFQMYLCDVWEEGGFLKYYRKEKQRKAETEAMQEMYIIQREEEERIENAYLNGELTRKELPRKLNAIDRFEFEEEMGLAVEEYNEVREIVYVENGYNESLNRFFMSHQDLRLYHMYKFIYLPCLSENLREDDQLINYLCPNPEMIEKEKLVMDSSYPLQFLSYPEDADKIKQGMFFFVGNRKNHGAGYIEGHYYPLVEGDDDCIIKQLDEIVKKVHSDYSRAGLYCSVKRPDIKEGSTDDYADRLFTWVNSDKETAQLVDEINDRMKMLEERGLPRNLILKLFESKEKLSRLIVTKDLRIILPDYNNMEIKMEPLVKAVYLLFLKHPEGIAFKYLPDYREELTKIYVKLKPYGMNERVLRSIEDVTNPCLNSINEKCARIRGAFVGQFDDSMAKNYYIRGERGEAKKISLPRDLIVWE